MRANEWHARFSSWIDSWMRESFRYRLLLINKKRVADCSCVCRCMASKWERMPQPACENRCTQRDYHMENVHCVYIDKEYIDVRVIYSYIPRITCRHLAYIQKNNNIAAIHARYMANVFIPLPSHNHMFAGARVSQTVVPTVYYSPSIACMEDRQPNGMRVSNTVSIFECNR